MRILAPELFCGLSKRSETRLLIDRVSTYVGRQRGHCLGSPPSREVGETADGHVSGQPKGMKVFARTALEPHVREVLSNGFRLIVKEDHFAPIVAAAIWVGTGAADDSPGQSGLAHFFEHMFFKGTETRTAGEMDRQIKALGGYNNAATSLDFTDYYVVLPSERYAEAIDIISDALLHSTFPPDEVENERGVILEEIRRQEDSPLGKLSTEFFAAAFRGTPYARPVLGEAESLAQIKQQDFREYYEERYRADNLVLVVVGDVETAEVISQAKGIFGSLRPGTTGPHQSLDVKPLLSPREFVIEKDVEQTYFSLGYAIPDVAGTTDEYALDVAAAILGEGRGSRFYQILVEDRGLVSFVDCTFSAYQQAGLFGVEVGLEEESVQEVRRVLLDEISRAERGEFTDREIERAKTLVTTGFTMSNEKASSIAGTLGLYEIMADLEAAIQYCNRIRRVTREDIRAAVQRYLAPSGYTLGILKPKAPA